jgi:hypothetical protein
MLLRLATAAVLVAALRGEAPATPFQTLRHCAEPGCSQYVLVEAENFTRAAATGARPQAAAAALPAGPDATVGGWAPRQWAHDPNLFSSDVSNVFMNRRAYLHADADATVGSSATASVTIPAAGNHTVLVRYEAGYRFSSPFTVEITQAGRRVYIQSYGSRLSPKVWGFGGCTQRMGGLAMLSAECRYNYGTTENMVWEGPSTSSNYTAELVAGDAEITLTVASVAGDITERNIDTLLLTPNSSDIAMRLSAASRPLQLDGLIGTQEGEVFAKVESHEDTPMNITLPLTSSRSPLWEGKLIYPAVTESRGKQAVVSSCGDRGRVSVAPAPPDPNACAACVRNSSEAAVSNCTAAEVCSAKPLPSQAACESCAASIAATHNCSATVAKSACAARPHKPDPESTCTAKALEAIKARCVSKCTAKKVAALQRACEPKRPPLPKPLPISESGCVTFVLRPREKTEWTDVGRLIDTMNHAAWNLPAGNYTISLGVKEAAGGMTELGVFPAMGRPLQILTDASIRATKASGVRKRGSDFWELYGKLKKLEPALHGRPPTHIPLFASTFQRNFPQGGLGALNGTGLPDPQYKAAQLEWEALFPISPTDVGSPGTGHWLTEWGYLDLRGYVHKAAVDDGGQPGEGGIAAAYPAAAEMMDNGYTLSQATSTHGPFDPDTAGRPPTLTLRQLLQQYVDAGVADKIRAIKLGDEIGLPRPPSNSSSDAVFFAWAKAKGLTPQDIGCSAFSGACHYNTSYALAESNAALFYHSQLFSNDFGIDSPYKNATATITEMLPNALAGANYAPTACKKADWSCMSYLPETFKWIRAFRAGTFTLPFTEDYIFQQPPGSQQMYTLVIDVERAAVRAPPPSTVLQPLAEMGAAQPLTVATAALKTLPDTATKPGRPIMQYVMAHYPGNTPKSWRRQFYGDLAHGVKYLHLYVFAPSFSSPAGDYVDADGGTYQEVLKSTRELGNWDDILSKSKPHAAGVKVALLFSETGDIFLDSYGTAGAAKRALYISLVHSQLAMDVLTEEDLIDGSLNSYAVLYLTHTFVNDKASQAIAKWVKAGGRLVSTVSGGMRNQANATNPAISAGLLGLTGDHSIYTGTRTGVDARVDFIKQDLAFAEVLDTVQLAFTAGDAGGNITTVVGEKAMVTPPPDATTLATFSDGSPAAFSRNVGSGKVFFFAFHPGLSYFHPAIPKRPVARGSTDECFNHWVPTDFDAQARHLAALPTHGIVGAAPVLSSEPRVDIGVLAAAKLGTVIPVTNWAGKPLVGLNLTLQFDCNFETAALASGGKVVASKTASGRSTFALDVDVADAIILRTKTEDE